MRAIEDPNLVARLADEGIRLDVCLRSNVALGAVSTLATHPLPKLLKAGVRCSVNADGPLLFSTSLLDEYAAAREHLGLDDAMLAGIARASWLD